MHVGKHILQTLRGMEDTSLVRLVSVASTLQKVILNSAVLNSNIGGTGRGKPMRTLQT